MRNLKRALSLALASVMLLGMMVVGTSAASYPDVDEKDNVEAIEVLNAVKVMIGDRGNFRPDAKVNRHEMAVIMAKLVLGNEAADNYVGSHPFTDVFPWADKYVAACYENGLVSGTSATTFSGNQPLTAVQAAAMMLRALGYKDLSKGATDWRAPVTAMANQIRLFNGVASNPKEELDRNQVAQLALNTLKSPVVTLKDNTFDITSGEGNVVISGGSREYIVRSSSEDYAYAINSTEYSGSSAAGIHGATVELGEHLYNGDLKLKDGVTDDFGRPSRRWEYDGKTIGTYMKKELMDEEWTNEVKGKDLYDLLGSDTIKNYDFEITIDGVNVEDKKSVMNDASKAASYFAPNNMAKNNKTAVGQTGKGVLTQVFVDPNYGKNGKVWVSVINTYLAKATTDYNEKKDEIKLDVYGLEEDTTTGVFYKFHNAADGFAVKHSGKDSENLAAAGEDFAKVVGMKKDDIVLVTVADGDIKTISDPEVLSAVELSEFSKTSYVVADKKYEYNTTIDYDHTVLDYYTGEGASATQQLKDTEYNLFLDPYGYLVGIEVVEAVKNYIFLTGIDQGSSNLNSKTADAAGILLDGTFINFSMNMKDSKQYGGAVFGGHALHNTWCTYTKDKNDVYTLKEVGGYSNVFTTNGDKSGQYADFASNNKKIDTKHVSLFGAADKYVYGNDDSIYLMAELKEVVAKNDVASNYPVAGDGAVDNTGNTVTAADSDKVGIISGVSSVGTGVDNVSIVTYEDVAAMKTAGEITSNAYPGWIYTLFDNDGYVIAAVVLGDDGGSSKNLVYSHKGSVESEKYDKADDEWTWTRKVIKDGEEILLTQKGDDEDAANGIETMLKNVWYEVTYKSDGTVKRVKLAHFDERNSAAGNEASNDADGGVMKVAIKDSKPGDFVCDIANLEYALTDGKDDTTTLYEEVWGHWTDDSLPAGVNGGKNAAMPETNAPSLKSSTLYVDTLASKGFYVHKDVKSVLIQTNGGDTTTTYGEGTSDLEGFLKDLNKKNSTTDTYLFKISAVLTSGRATTVVIHDLVVGPADTIPVNPKDDEDTGDVNVYVTFKANDGTSDVVVGTEQKVPKNLPSDGRIRLTAADLAGKAPTGYHLDGSDLPMTVTKSSTGNYAEVSVKVVRDTRSLKLPSGWKATWAKDSTLGIPASTATTEFTASASALTGQIPLGASVTVTPDASAATYYLYNPYVDAAKQMQSNGTAATVASGWGAFTMPDANNTELKADQYVKVTVTQAVTKTGATNGLPSGVGAAYESANIQAALAATNSGVTTVNSVNYVKAGDTIKVTLTCDKTHTNDTVTGAIMTVTVASTGATNITGTVADIAASTAFDATNSITVNVAIGGTADAGTNQAALAFTLADK